MSDVERRGTAALSTTVSSLPEILGTADGGGGGDGEKEEEEGENDVEKKTSETMMEVGKDKNVLEKQQPKSDRGWTRLAAAGGWKRENWEKRD